MDSTSTLAQAKSAVFGDNPALGTDGQPLERGVGSHWHRAEHIAKAHFHAADAWAATDDLVTQAKSILATAQKIAAAAKASIEAAAKAKEETPVPPDPKDDQAYKDLLAQFNQAVAERDVLKDLPAATAHNVARDAAEQKLLDDYRAEAEAARLKKIADDKAAADAAAAEKAKTVPVAPPPPAIGITEAEPKPIVPVENSNLSFAVVPGREP